MNSLPTTPEENPLDKQVGGSHYKDKGIADLEKAKHYLELLIELHAKAA